MKKREDDDETNYIPWIIASFVLFFFCAIIYLGTFMADKNILKSKDFEMKSMKMSSVHRGEFSLSEVNHQVYKKFGYEITEPVLPIPIVNIKQEPKCEKIFMDWLKKVESPIKDPPHFKLPVILEREFTLNGYSKLQYTKESNVKSLADQEPSGWGDFKTLMTSKLSDIAELEYNEDGMSVHHAMQVYSLSGKRGLIFSSKKPWLEILALQHGADHLVTVEDQKPSIPAEFQDRIEHVEPTFLADNWEQYSDSFDFAISFSKIQKVGLGEQLDPVADLREMLKIKCLLKPGGLFFFGAPFGEDELIFNKGRVYGPVRLAMMLHGFELVAGFNGQNPSFLGLGDKSQIFSNSLKTLVLRKLQPE